MSVTTRLGLHALNGATIADDESVAARPRAPDLSKAVSTLGSPEPADDALQVAARLKLLMGTSGGFLAVAGLDDRDRSTDLSIRLTTAMATISRSPVLLIEGTETESGVHTQLGVPGDPGLLNVLSEECDISSAVYRVSNTNLFVMPYGTSSSTTASLLGSSHGAMCMKGLRAGFHSVFADVGSLLLHPESLLLASMADGVIAALAQGVRRQEEVVRFKKDLSRLKLRLFGVVLTRGKEK